MIDEDKGIIREEEETKKRNKLIKKWTDLLLESSIDYSLKSWNYGGGMTITVNSFIDIGDDSINYPIEIDISDDSFATINLKDGLEEFILDRQKKKWIKKLNMNQKRK